MAASFIGRGIAFPLGGDASGRLALVGGAADVERSIRLILATYPGERPMRPEFGSTIADYVFAPADATTAGRLANAVRVALDRWEPRIDLDDVLVHLDAADQGVLFLEIRYRLRGTNDPRNLVFPFYVIPEHEDSAPTRDDRAGALTSSATSGRR
jgi:phage baseplate assembly protein W